SKHATVPLFVPELEVGKPSRPVPAFRRNTGTPRCPASPSRNPRVFRQRQSAWASALGQKLTRSCAVSIVARRYSPLQRLPTSHGSLKTVTRPCPSTLRRTWRRPAVRGRRPRGSQGDRYPVRRRGTKPRRLWAGVRPPRAGG